MGFSFSRRFHQSARALARNLEHRYRIQTAMSRYYAQRDEMRSRFRDWQSARTAAGGIKYEAINRMDKYLVEFADRISARGAKVFWASTGLDACRYIAAVAKAGKVRCIVKSKTMTGEEIHLGQALEKEGYQVVESDLGEFIVQLRQEAPYHIVFPAMHLSRNEVSAIFQEKLGSHPTDNPEELTLIARQALRELYCTAEMGISGANFAVAETGMISITENEGNARLSTSLPRIHVAIVGIEKIIPKVADLALLLPMLATAGAGQPLTCYNTLIGGPRQPGETDGPEEMHVVFLDNGRTTLLADSEQRDALHCIRCGACLNVCPIYKNIGGHSYGTTYQGPIGSVITPHLRGLQSWKHLSSASSLCGACTETCPVRIDLHHHLLQNRRNAVRQKPTFTEQCMYRIFGFVMKRPQLYRWASPLIRIALPLHRKIQNSFLDPVRAWTQSRDLPPAPAQSFKEIWRNRNAP
ncbi:MAG: iron-sulfur cluster-binding protein [Verrucomicrobia bacterium]|nr:MAG: iron-sulfur cluster-binding protein [Verrucomicrobiota bacterium]